MLTTRLLFDIGSLLLSKDLLGEARAVTYRGRAFSIVFPRNDDSFTFSKQEAWSIHAFGTPTGRLAKDSTALYTKIRFGPMSSTDWTTIQALAIDTSLPEAAALVNQPSLSSSSSEAQAYRLAVRSLIPDAIALVEDLVGWIRVLTSQYWLPTGDDQIRPLRPVLLLDEQGEPMFDWFEHAPGDALVMLEGDYALIGQQLEDAVVHLSEGDPVPEPELLVQDARYHAIWGSSRDRARATLFAAMACEAKVKSALLDGATETLRAFVSDVIRHRDFPSMSMARMFDSPCRAVFGISMRESDDDLWKAVDRLFTARNKFVHERTIPARDDAMAHVEAADAAVKWDGELANGSHRSGK